MKTTIEISDSIYRQVKARTALKGQTIKSFFLEALREKLESDASDANKDIGWMQVFSKADKSAVKQVQVRIDEEFSKIAPEDWT